MFRNILAPSPAPLYKGPWNSYVLDITCAYNQFYSNLTCVHSDKQILHFKFALHVLETLRNSVVFSSSYTDATSILKQVLLTFDDSK